MLLKPFTYIYIFAVTICKDGHLIPAMSNLSRDLKHKDFGTIYGFKFPDGRIGILSLLILVLTGSNIMYLCISNLWVLDLGSYHENI